MALLHADLSQVADLIGKGIERTLADAIERQFKEQIDPLIKQLAIEYAEKVAAKVQTMQMYHDNKIELAVIFNDKNILKKILG
jgi:hypothetical protein